MFQGGEFYPTGRLTREAVEIVVGAIRGKLEKWDKAKERTMREAGVARSNPGDVGYDHKTAAELDMD